jgi:toxin ParE1/3/4
VSGFRVDFSEEAEDDLLAIRDYLAAHADEAIADQFIEALIARCESLSRFADRGSPRDDLAAGVRTIGHKKSVLIAYRVREKVVTVLGFFSRGRDVTAAFRERQQD